MSFFADRRPGRPGLALFLNAGDPPLPTFRELVLMLDEAKVDCLELAIPFPNSASDGPVIRASASRALEDGVDRDAVLEFIGDVRPELEHLKIALLADWSYSIKGTPMREFLERVHASGADGLLVHGLPPRLKPEYYEAAGTVDLPIVTTCYATSDPADPERGRRARLGLHLPGRGVRPQRHRRAARSQHADPGARDAARADRRTGGGRIRGQGQEPHRRARGGRRRRRDRREHVRGARHRRPRGGARRRRRFPRTTP